MEDEVTDDSRTVFLTTNVRVVPTLHVVVDGELYVTTPSDSVLVKTSLLRFGLTRQDWRTRITPEREVGNLF